MTSKLTREQVIALITEHSYDSALVDALEYLLAAMDSEPVAYIFKHPSGKLFWALTDESNKGRRDVMPVYAAPQPAPVVPDAATAIRACLSEFPESARDIVEECADIAENACRTAMLQDEPVTTANKLGNSPAIPDGYVMVPKEPTEEMNKAGWAAMNEHDAINPTYRAMLAAAPQEVKGE